jgi:transcriptional regulator of acetoin/glycerol metabolism
VRKSLENVIERAIILGHGPQLLPEDLPAHLYTHTSSLPRDANHLRPTLEALERDYMATVLQETGWHRMKAADILGIDRRTLYRKIHTYDLQPSR